MYDHGPKPMKDLRPAKKQSTAAEKFQTEHHGRYKDRIPKSRDKISQVQDHNRAFPTMNDELKKRRSVANPTALVKGKALRARRSYKSSTVKRRKFKSRKQNGRLQSKYKISKSKSRRFKPFKRYLRIVEMMDKGCQYALRHIYANKCTVSNRNCKIYGQDDKNNDKYDKGETSILFNTESEHRRSRTSIDNDVKTDVDSQNPDTSASLTSYHSYLSMDHEPMV